MRKSILKQMALTALTLCAAITHSGAQRVIYAANSRIYDFTASGTQPATEITVTPGTGSPSSAFNTSNGFETTTSSSAGSWIIDISDSFNRAITGVTVTWRKKGSNKTTSVIIQASVDGSSWTSYATASTGSSTSSATFTDLVATGIPSNRRYARASLAIGAAGANVGLCISTIEVDFDPLPVPGNVSAGLQQWLIAGTGVVSSAGNISKWYDNSGADYNLFQGTSGNQPDTVNNGLNFNPSVKFAGANNDFLSVDNTACDIAGSAVSSIVSAYIVSQENTRAASASTVFPFSLKTAAGTSTNQLYYSETGGNIKWNASTGSQSVAYPYAAGAANLKTFINNSVSTTKVQSIATNGKVNITSATSVAATAANTVNLGGLSTAGTSFDGQIPEFILFNTQLSAANHNKILSYLALKYGIHLDQTTATNYVASNWNGTTGTKIWNAATAASGFNNSIFGIGRDSTSGLLQKVSTSANGDALFVMALQNDFTSANASASRTTGFGRDTSFVMLAHNAAAFTFSTTGIMTYDGHTRMARAWQVQKQGIADSVYLGFHKDSLTTIPADCDLYLMASNNNNFIQRENITWYAQWQLNATTGYYWLKIPATHLQYLTIAAIAKSGTLPSLRHRKRFLFGDLKGYGN